MNETLRSIIRIIEKNPKKDFWFRTETMNELLSQGTMYVEEANLVINIEECIITVETAKMFDIKHKKYCYFRLKSVKDLYNRNDDLFDAEVL